MSRRISSTLFAILVLTACAPKNGHDVSQDSPTVSGLESIRAADMRAHVATLASDEYAGRETLTAGADQAAAYIAKRFEKLGLAPLPGHRNFTVPYQLRSEGFDADSSDLAIRRDGAKAHFVPGEDFAPFFFSSAGTVNADVVFAGYGITAPDLGHDDYEGLDVKGKLVLVLRHTPQEKKEDNSFNGTEHALFLTKATNAQKHGALGMLLVTDPLHHTDADDLRFKASLGLPRTETKKVGETEEGDEEKFLAVHISREAAAAFLGSGPTLADLQTSLDAGQKPGKLGVAPVPASLRIAKLPAQVVEPTNVIGLLKGSDPKVADQWVVVGAHFDHLGGFHGEGDTVFNGADDNASGTSGLLELAEAFASRSSRPRRTIAFMGFSGEEKGLLGSRALLEQEIVPADQIVFMLNLDMIGRNSEEPVAVFGDGYATMVKEVTEKANAGAEANIEFAGESYAGNSDHHPFYQKDIPVMFFFTGTHDDYHQLGDHADKLDYENMEKIGRLAFGVLDSLASADRTPKFIHRIQWLGATVQVVEQGGKSRVAVTDVADPSRGAVAGLRRGDTIQGLDGESLDPAKVGESFRGIKPGSSASLSVLHEDGNVAIVKVERAKTGYLGVMPAGVDDDLRKKLGLGDGEGVRIGSVVPEGPAHQGGLRAEDIVIQIAGVPIGARNLGRELSRIGAGEKVELLVARKGERLKLEITLGERPER